MKKGFSLVELLAVLVILGLLGLISVPIVNLSIKKSKEKAREVQINEIISAAKKYAIKNSYVLPQDENTSNFIYFEEIVHQKFLDSEQIIDPVTKKYFNGCIKVCYKCSKVEYDYSFETECEE